MTANVSTSPAIISDVEAGGHEWFMMNVCCQGCTTPCGGRCLPWLPFDAQANRP